MKHTIYLTSGQTAEVKTDGTGSIEQGESIYFECGGREIARFKKSSVAGVRSIPEFSDPSVDDFTRQWCKKNGVGMVERPIWKCFGCHKEPCECRRLPA